MRTVHRSLTAVVALGAALSACSSSPTEHVESGTSALRASPALHEFGSRFPHKRLCAPAGPGQASCFAHVRTDEAGNIVANNNPAGAQGFGPADLAAAYSIPTAIPSNATIAIVDAYDYPNALADVSTYRSNYGLPALCSGCFTRVGQTGTSTFPTQTDAGWQGEMALDLDMASAACPSCKILLVEANSTSTPDLFGAIDTAVRLGATVVSNSWGGGPEDEVDLNHPGVAIFASSGDGGYGVQYPAGSPFVTAVGGTSLTVNTGTTRGWSETVWSGAGSGCTSNTKPSWQKDTGCAGRTIADVSAVADPDTGVAVYDSGRGGWIVLGGTSVASPLVAGIYALTSNGTATGQLSYVLPSEFNDVVSGSNGSCGTYLCNGGPGYDGPTGNGTPNGRKMLPAVTGISPTSGPNVGGTVVTITGRNFDTTGKTTVSFGGAAATGVSCSSPTQCTATSPSFGAGDNFADTVDVQVTVPGNFTTAAVAADKFTFTAGPSCTSTVTCAGIAFGFPNLVIQCPSTTDFYEFFGTPNQTLASVNTSFTVGMDNSSQIIGACVSGGSCTGFSNYESDPNYCGSSNNNPPPTCNGVPKPTRLCKSGGWHCCDDGWECGQCQ
jgi:hypothetical protein